MQPRFVAIVATVALPLSVSLAVQPAVASTLPGWTAFAKAVDRINDYSVTVTTHEIADGRIEDRVYDCIYAKPGLARSSISSGPGRGSEAVWHGGDLVRGHPGGFLRGIKIDVPEHDRRATDLRGKTIEMGYFPTIVHTFETIGTLSEAPGPEIAGIATDAITLVPSDPAQERNLTREVLVLSSETHLPIEHLGYEGDALVEREAFSRYVIDPSLPPSTFDL